MGATQIFAYSTFAPSHRLKRLLKGVKPFKVACRLHKSSERIFTTVACEDLAGSAINAEIRSQAPAIDFPEEPLHEIFLQESSKVGQTDHCRSGHCY